MSKFEKVRAGWNDFQHAAHSASANAGWWDACLTPDGEIDPEKLDAVIPVKLLLTHSEISEAMEGHRCSKMDDKLPQHSMLAVELADAAIRIADLAGACGFDLGQIIALKMDFNASRPDHTRSARASTGGKRY